MNREYPIAPQDFADTPIVLEYNPLTGYNDGEDAPNVAVDSPGYRNMKTLAENDEPLVVPADIMQRSVLDGYDEYGHGYDVDKALPGGLKGRVLVVREMTARMLDEAQKTVNRYYPGLYDVALLDGFESGKRQASGFGRALKNLLAGKGLLEKGGEAPKATLTQIYEAGVKADYTYASVKADTGSAAFDLAVDELMGDSTKEEIVEIAKTHDVSINDVLSRLITFMTNAGIEFADIAKIPLDYECNAHAGGSSADVMLTNKDGKLLNLVPYCHTGPEAGMAYMEDPGAYKKFMKTVKRNPGLREHLKKLGYESPEKFTRHEWDIFKAARRVRFHVFKSLGATFFSAHNPAEGGEDWHYESPGVRLYGPDGRLIIQTDLAGAHPDDSGNPGHTLQKLGPKETAVYGGGSAHRLARRDYGLED